jgi:uncharacterized membrane protein YidH (DUF202 family)
MVRKTGCYGRNHWSDKYSFNNHFLVGGKNMDMDIRIPIGLLFVILGIILAAFGIFTINDTELYVRSLGRNINLWTGILMLVFGGCMLLFPILGKMRKV